MAKRKKNPYKDEFQKRMAKIKRDAKKEHLDKVLAKESFENYGDIFWFVNSLSNYLKDIIVSKYIILLKSGDSPKDYYKELSELEKEHKKKMRAAKSKAKKIIFDEEEPITLKEIL